MTIIKIEPNDNGSHDNQTIYGYTLKTFPVPEGWALIPEEIGTPDTLENFPFGEITVHYFDNVATVSSWTPLPIPEPGPEPERGYTETDLLSALLGG